MKKRIITVVLALCITCMCGLFAGCGMNSSVIKGEDASTYNIICSALEKSKNLDSMAAEMKMEMNMVTEGMTLSIPATIDMKAKGLKSDSPILSEDISMTMMGQTIEMQLYQEGEWAYVISNGMEYKTSIADVGDELDYTNDINNMLQDIPEELLKDVKMSKGDDGSATVNVPIPDEQFADIYNDYIEDLSASYGIEFGEIKISNAVVEITVANGYISVYDMEFTMDITIEGVSTTTDVTASIAYKDPGEEVNITPPEGYENFEEISTAALTE